MKDLKTTIFEKLKINKDSKSNQKNYKPQEILNWLGINNGSCERWEILYDHVKDWLDIEIKNDELELCADPETVNECKLPKEIKELINTSLYVNEWCQSELEKAHGLYTNYTEDIDLNFNKHMICNITQHGTLYVINKTYYLEHEES